jgi:hypothetical protein
LPGTLAHTELSMKWLQRIRGALLMGLIWALAWMPVGLLIGMILDPDGRMDEPWIAVGTLPGFLAGVMFSVVLGIAARRRRLDELSVAKFGGLGALAGFVIGSLPLVLGDQDGRTGNLWLLPVVVVTSITLLSAASAAASLVLARKSQERESLESPIDMARDAERVRYRE